MLLVVQHGNIFLEINLSARAAALQDGEGYLHLRRPHLQGAGRAHGGGGGGAGRIG